MWLQRIGRGLVAGAVGTAVMDTSQTALIPAVSSWLQSWMKAGDNRGDQRNPQQSEQPGESEQDGQQSQSQQQPLSSPEKVARRGAKILGIELDRKETAAWGNRIHWVYGIQWGAIYHVVRPQPGLQSGLLYGAVLWLVSDEMLLWGLGIAEAPTRYPLATHLKALAAHCIYGSVVGVTAKGLRDP